MTSAAATLRDMRRCFGGRVPAVIATADARGNPNVTYVSVIHQVDEERIALSDQFLSKTARNLAENPRASLLLLDPQTFAEYRVAIRYERTERRGHVFDRLRAEIDRVAALTGMQDVFRLRSADIYRVDAVEVLSEGVAVEEYRSRSGPVDLVALGELVARLGRCADLDALVDTCLRGLDELLGYRHASIFLLDETGRRLYAMGSHGFSAQGVGSEIVLGDGVVGAAAQRGEPVRIGHLHQLTKYARSVGRSHGPSAERTIDVPTLPDAESQLAVPAMSRGELVGVLTVQHHVPAAFDEQDEAALAAVAAVVASAVIADRSSDAVGSDAAERGDVAHLGGPPVCFRHFVGDGSIFCDDEYVIRGVAGRLLWSLLGQYLERGREEFSTRELRLDATLQLPAIRDNLDTRLILLKRRLDEQEAPVRIHRTGRGRFRLTVSCAPTLELVEDR